MEVNVLFTHPDDLFTKLDDLLIKFLVVVFFYKGGNVTRLFNDAHVDSLFYFKPDNVSIHRARTIKLNIETRPRKGSVCNALLSRQ